MDVISLKSTIQTANHNFRAQDQTDYSAITYFVDSKSVLKLQGPSATLYNNTNFASPDFNYPGTLTKDMDIPLVSNAIPQGTYILTATTRVTKTCPIISISLASNYILVDLILLDNFTAGQTITLAGGPNAGTYTIQSISSNAFGTILTLTQTLLSATATDEVTFDEEITTIKTYTYCYTAPIPVLVLTPSCETATLVVSQTTNYAIICEGQTIQPTTNSSEVTLNAPLNSSGQPVYPQTVSGTLPFSTTELWTQTWTASIVTTLVYELPSGLFIETSVTSTKSIDVSCDDSLCCMSQCLQNATNTFNTIIASGNFNTISSALTKYTQIIGAFMMYSVGVKCGDITTIDTAIANMKALLADTDCCNNCNDNGQSVQIIPIYNVIVSGNNVVVAAPDVYLDLSTTVVGSTTIYSLTLNTTQVQNLINDYIIDNPTIITTIVNGMHLGSKIFSNNYTSFDAIIQFTGSTNLGSDIIDGISMVGGNFSDLELGDPIKCSTFPLNTYIISIGATSIQVSDVATSTQPSDTFVLESINQGIRVQKHIRSISGIDSYYYKVDSQVEKSIKIDSITQNFELDGDEASPDPFDMYAVDSGGNKGWLAYLTAISNYTKIDTDSAVSISNIAATYLTLNLDAGTYIITAWGAFTTANHNVVMDLKNGGTTIVTGIQEGATVCTMSVIYKYTSASAITLNLVLRGVGGSLTGDFISLKAERIS